MATIFYGINVGAEESTVTIASTTTGKDVEVAINSTTNVASRDLLAVALERLKNVIDKSPFTPI
jgi:hypothetical protein